MADGQRADLAKIAERGGHALGRIDHHDASVGHNKEQMAERAASGRINAFGDFHEPGSEPYPVIDHERGRAHAALCLLPDAALCERLGFSALVLMGFIRSQIRARAV